MKPLDDYGYVNPQQPPQTKRPNGNGSAPAAPLPQGETALALLRRDIAAPIMLCDPWIVEGINLDVGRPKLGKSTLGRQKMAAVAEGATFWGSACERSCVLHLSLEEGERLTRRKYQQAKFSDAALENIRVFYQWPRGYDGVLQLGQYLKENPEVRYVMVDSLTRFRSIPDKNVPAFVADYESISQLQEVLKPLPGVCVSIIHHVRKLKTDDPLDAISGTYGLSAAIDSYTIMQPQRGGAQIRVGGRLWEKDDEDYIITRGDQRWELEGVASTEQTLPPGQRVALDAARRERGITPTRLADELGITRASAQERLLGLAQKGLVNNKLGTYFAN